MGGRGGTSSGGSTRTGGAAPEKLSKEQRSDEQRQKSIIAERNQESKSAAEAAIRDALNVAIGAAEAAGGWTGLPGTEIQSLVTGVYREAKAEQKREGKEKGTIKQESANRIVRNAMEKELKAYDRTVRIMEGKMRGAYERAGFNKPATDFEKRQFDRVVSLAANNAMKTIYSDAKRAIDTGRGLITSTNVTGNFLRKGLEAAIASLRI